MVIDRTPPELIRLMQRFNQLGRLLPNPDDVDEIRERRDEIALILQEMRGVKQEIDAILDANRRRRADA
jgi:hypothetical protein